MGTRADFYIDRGVEAEWIGSIALDGYPSGIPLEILTASTPETFREAVSSLAKEKDDFTSPEMGWPWPWDNSNTTDYAYAFENGKVYASCFGHDWFVATEPEPDLDLDETGETAIFPCMKNKQNVTFGKRSGLIIVSAS